VSCLPDFLTAAKKNLGVILEKSMGGGGGDHDHLSMHQRLNHYRGKITSLLCLPAMFPFKVQLVTFEDKHFQNCPVGSNIYWKEVGEKIKGQNHTIWKWMR